MTDPTPPPQDPNYAQTVDERVAVLVANGYAVQSRSATQVILVGGRRPNHTLHLLLTIFTAGLWGIVWIILSAINRPQTKVITIGDHGMTETM